jgi:hypothetical protein
VVCHNLMHPSRGIPGNEEADIAAEDATRWRREVEGEREGEAAIRRAEHPEHLRSQTAAVMMVIKQDLMKRWKTSWGGETKEAHLRRVTPEPTKKILSLLIL